MENEEDREIASDESEEIGKETDQPHIKTKKEVVPVTIYKREELEDKLDRVKKVTLKIFNKFAKKKLKKVPWIEHLTICNLLIHHIQ